MSSPTHSSSSFSHRSFASSALPPLPRIGDSRLLTQIFTHRSLARRPKRSFEDSPDDPSPDNEQLVHIGDPVFSLVVTDLIRDLFPHLSVGPSSKVRDRLKHTATLARVAVLYRLHERLQVQTAQANEVRASQNAQAEVFKAYVGGLYREQGMGPVNEWLRSLFQLYVLDAYENERKEHLLPPLQPPTAPTVRYVS
jgi:ribonuclease-3